MHKGKYDDAADSSFHYMKAAELTWPAGDSFKASLFCAFPAATLGDSRSRRYTYKEEK